MHVAEDLGIARIAQNMREACELPELSVDDLGARARAGDDETPYPDAPTVAVTSERYVPRRWLIATVAIGAVTALGVLEGRVKVETAARVESLPLGAHSVTSPKIGPYHADSSQAPPAVEVVAGRQTQVEAGKPIPAPSAVDTRRTSAWLHRQIVFEHEPLELVATEFNRYAATPVEIDTPALRALKISGVFSTDDTESFVAFLRSLDGVRVQVTPTSIHVTR
jgi:ferric-dicitrate binding protein FerR (iron transport regulator)